MTKGALEMGNEEYIIQWDDMTPEAKAKKDKKSFKEIIKGIFKKIEDKKAN